MRGSSPRESAIVRLGILYRVLLYGVIRLSVGQEVVALFRLVRLRHNPLYFILCIGVMVALQILVLSVGVRVFHTQL